MSQPRSCVPAGLVRKFTRREQLAMLAAAAGLGSCATVTSNQKQIHAMGERVQVGPLIYIALEAEWKNELGSGTSARIPQSKFLVLRVTVTNAGNREVSIPLLHLAGEGGGSHLELAEGQGVDDWLGVLRNVNPAETIQGRLLFDVPPANYFLRATDGGEPDSERVALISIPFKIKESGPLAPVTGDK